MILRKERNRNIKIGSEVFSTDAGFGQHGLADVEAHVLGVVGPGAGI